MGRKSNRRLKLLLLICGFMGLTMLPFAVSYSQASISNAASIRITDTKNALIAVNLKDWDVCFLGDTVEGTITNNLDAPLISLSVLERGASIPSSLDPGKEGALIITATRHGLHSGEIVAYWQNGCAKVPYSTYIEVVDPAALDVIWDAKLAQISVVNNSGYDLTATVGDKSVNLSSNGSAHYGQSGSKSLYLANNGLALFERTGDTTTVTFSLGEQRTYTISIPTLLPPSPAPQEDPQEDEPMEEPPAEEAPRGEQETINTSNNNLPVSEETISAGDDTMPEGETEAIEQFIEP